MTGTYQLWSYEANDIEIRNHMILAEKQQRSDIEIMLKQSNRASIKNYLVSKKYGDGSYPNLTYYIRDESEPTYLIYTVNPSGEKQLTNVIFNIDSAKNKVEFITQTFKKYNIPYIVLMETRDDNHIRINMIGDFTESDSTDTDSTETDSSDESTDGESTDDESTDDEFDNIIQTAQSIISRLDRFSTNYNPF